MRASLILLAISILLLSEVASVEPQCPCFNQAKCIYPPPNQLTSAQTNQQPNSFQCDCQDDYLGLLCQQKAHMLASHTPLELKLKASKSGDTIANNFTYMYFQPESSDYKFTFKICVKDNPQRKHNLFYFETETNQGTFKQNPTIYNIIKIIVVNEMCIEYAINYLSIAESDEMKNSSSNKAANHRFKKVLFGIKIFLEEEKYTYSDIETTTKMKVKKDSIEKADEKEKVELDTPKQEIPTASLSQVQSQEINQKLTIEFFYEVTSAQHNYSTSMTIIFTTTLLFIFIIYAFSIIRRKYFIASQRSIEEIYQDHELPNARNNPQDQYYSVGQRKKQCLHNLEIFMPVQAYHNEMKGGDVLLADESQNEVREKAVLENDSAMNIQHEINLSAREKAVTCKEKAGCSICLVEYDEGDEIRTTPCNHVFHRDCIDSWYGNSMSCPICRRKLDFRLQIRAIYRSMVGRRLIHD